MLKWEGGKITSLNPNICNYSQRGQQSVTGRVGAYLYTTFGAISASVDPVLGLNGADSTYRYRVGTSWRIVLVLSATPSVWHRSKTKIGRVRVAAAGTRIPYDHLASERRRDCNPIILRVSEECPSMKNNTRGGSNRIIKYEYIKTDDVVMCGAVLETYTI